MIALCVAVVQCSHSLMVQKLLAGTWHHLASAKNQLRHFEPFGTVFLESFTEIGCNA